MISQARVFVNKSVRWLPGVSMKIPPCVLHDLNMIAGDLLGDTKSHHHHSISVIIVVVSIIIITAITPVLYHCIASQQFCCSYYEFDRPVLVTSDVDILQQITIKQFSKFHSRKVSHKTLHQIQNYRKTSYISRTLVGNKIADNSDVVGASPVGTAPTTSSFST